MESACGSNSNLTTSDDFRHQLFFIRAWAGWQRSLPIGFQVWEKKLVSGIQVCKPTTETGLSEEALKSLATHYRIQLKAEELLDKSFIKRRMEKETVPDPATVFQMLDEDAFPFIPLFWQNSLKHILHCDALVGHEQ